MDQVTISKFTPEALVYDKLSEVVQHCLAEAIGASAIDGGKIPEGFFNDHPYKVVLVINGVQFSFVKLMEHHWKQYDGHVRVAARARAEDVLQREFGDRLERAMKMMKELFPLRDDEER